MCRPDSLHERDGRQLLADRGIDDRLARFAETHASGKRTEDGTLGDLLIALADTCWKGKRAE